MTAIRGWSRIHDAKLFSRGQMPVQLYILAIQNQGAVPAEPYPLIIMLLVLAWVGFIGAAAITLLRFEYPRNHSTRWAPAVPLGIFAFTVLGAALLSPPPPVLCTYTGLSHVTSAYHIAALEWNWLFPSDYPLAVPVFASLFTKILGQSPEAFGWANTVLAGLGAVGICLSAMAMLGTLQAGIVAGVTAALLPLTLMLARSDSMTVGYFALSAWTALFGFGLLKAESRMQRAVPFVGLVMTLALACQSRLEGPVLLAVAALAPLAFSNRASWRKDLWRIVQPIAVALLLTVPYLTRFYAEFVGGGRLSGELGDRLVWRIGLVAAFAAAAMLFAGYRQGICPVSGKTRAYFALGLIVSYAFLVMLEWGPAFFGPGPICFGVGCSGLTFDTFFSWHLNPKATPLPLILLFAGGLTACDTGPKARRLVFLVLWMALVLMAASTKATGELPFEGARTQLPATVPFALIVALGAQFALGRLRAGWHKVLLVGAVTAPFYFFSGANLVDLDYNQQREFRFLTDCLAKLPPRAVIYAPDDVLTIRMIGDDQTTQVELYHLYRTGYVVEAMGTAAGVVRVSGASALFEPARESGNGERFFLKNLNCYRTGTDALTPICGRAESELAMEPVCETTIDNRMYTFDFYEPTRIVGETIQLGVYKVLDRQVGVENAIP